MPSVPGFPTTRREASAPPAGREFSSYDWYDAATLVLAANATFQEAITFSGKPDAIIVQISAVPVNVRFRNRGQAGGQAIRLGATGQYSFQVRCEIVEVQDAAGAGGQTFQVTGLYGTRHIDRRENKGGPYPTHVHSHEDATAEQVETR